MAARCTTPAAALHHFCGMGAPWCRCRSSGGGVCFARSGCRITNGQGVVLARRTQPVMANKNGRSNTKSISSSGGAAAPAIIMTVYAAAVTPSSSMATRAAWSALERNISATFEVMGLKSATVASNTPVIPSAFRPSRRSRSETTSNLGTDIFTIRCLLFSQFPLLAYAAQKVQLDRR